MEEGEAGGWEQRLSPELGLGLRILRELLQERHRGLPPALLRGDPPGGPEEEGTSGGEEPGGPEEEEPGEQEEALGESSPRGEAAPNPGTEAEASPGGPERAPPAGLLGMLARFRGGRYRELAEFVSDVRRLLERVYLRRGLEHWLSRQAQRLERMLEQKLALLPRPLREKTAIVVTSNGRYGLEDEKPTTCTSTRRRSTTRSLAGQTTGVFESVMVQALRQEEQLRAKQEKRLREQEKKEAEEASYKEIDEWDKNLLAQTAPTCMENMWEIPAVGHFLCLAQQILNLPEIVFYELERCLLMPQTNVFLSKIMTSLLTPPHRRPSLHRRAPLPYSTWEAALRQKVQQWYSLVGQAENPDSCAERLGLCSQFFRSLGEISPLEEKPFHELSFLQKVWLLKGLCDFVYETQKEVQDAVLGQPIHECREVILGYDSQEHAYIHFPQFCGADVRIYRQIPFYAPEYPITPIKIRKLPRIKMEKVKCESKGSSSGEVKCVSRETRLSNPKTEPETQPNDCSAKFHVDCCSVYTEEGSQPNCEMKMWTSCDLEKAGCCKENLKKLVSPGNLLGYRDPLCPGEIRIVENGDKYVERPLGKAEPSPLKENTLKTCRVHVNGSHCDNPGMNCHRVAKDIIREHSLLNRKKLKLSKLRGKKKKKKKKKPKCILNENLHGKHVVPQSHSFKSYKSEIQSKMFLKKKTKHKKHKSGKKSISKRGITKKRKTVSWPPTIPEFQLVCTNLEELRKLITKIDVELKEFGNDRKKLVKSHVRKQTVRELHSTLKRLLKELLPWEPKLMKAFQRNRARLKKEYDDFERQPDRDKFTREVWPNEESDVGFGKESPCTETKTSFDPSENEESMKKDDMGDINISEMDLVPGKSKMPCKELFPKEAQQTLPKACKRQCKEDGFDNGTKEILPSKKIKLSICENTRHCMDVERQTGCCPNERKETEPANHDSLALIDSEASFSSFLKVTTPVQALMAKNIGDKVTLTNQLMSNASRSVNVSDRLTVSPAESSPTKAPFLCQTSTKNPLQVVYKMPGGQCVPIDLHNSSVKIQMQPVIDPKTGEKLLQQVLILPKNFFIQHKEGTSTGKESLPLQMKSTERQFAHFPQAINLNSSFTAPVLVPAHSQLTSSVLSKSVLHLAKLTHPVKSPPLPIILASTTNVCQNYASKVATSTTTFPIITASSDVPTAVQPSTSLAKFSRDASDIFSPRETLHKASDSSEIKQELKTVCIRDSQSILVRTRGGNTGVVKVQNNPEKCSTSSLATGSVFTCTPQLQAFLIPRSTTLPFSTLSSVTTTTTVSTVLPFAQSTMSRFSSPAPVAISACLNQLIGNRMKMTTCQPPSVSNLGHVVDNTVQSSILSTSSHANSWLPPSSSSSIGALNIATVSADTMDSGSMGQNNAVNTQIIAPHTEIEHKTKLPIVQPDSTTPTDGDVISGAPVQNLLLVTSRIPSGDASLSTSSAATSQKLVFINTDISSGTTSRFAAESTNQSLPPAIGKTLLNSPEQPRIVLLPCTVGAGSNKFSASPTVSQIKEVKIGGQTIINTPGTAHHVPPVNLLHSASDKGTDDKNRKGFSLPVTTSNLVPLCPLHQNTVVGNDSGNVGTHGASVSTGTTVNACLGSFSATNSSTSVASSTVLVNHGNGNPSRIPFVGNSLCTSNVGNTVAISTVKTGHLASSVLISTTQSTVAPQSSPTTLFPGVVSFPAPVTTTHKGKHFVPATVPCLSLPNGPPQTLLPFQSTGHGASSNTTIQKPQNVFPSVSPISLSNVASLPPSTKTHPCTSAPGVSSVMQTTIASPFNSQAGQFGETSIQHKIVLNTNTPLAPGTQIMINGTRFIVPTNGLGAGSHVLLISTNAKQGLPLVLNSAQGVQKLVHRPVIPKNPPTRFLTWQSSRHPLKSCTNIVNSLCSPNAPPIVHATPQVADSTAKVATTITMATIPRPQSTFVAKTSLVPDMRACNPQCSSSTSVMHLDASAKKLLVSPEGAILNSINTSVAKLTSLSTACSHIVESQSKRLPTVFLTPQSTSSTNLNTDV